MRTRRRQPATSPVVNGRLAGCRLRGPRGAPSRRTLAPRATTAPSANATSTRGGSRPYRYASHERPRVAKGGIERGGVPAGEAPRARRPVSCISRRQRVVAHARSGMRGCEVEAEECFVEELRVAPAHSGMASLRTCSRMSGRSEVSGTTSTLAPKSAVSSRSTAESSSRLTG